MTATVHTLRPDVFSMRDDLAKLHQLARAKRAGPDAVLALTITHVLAATEPDVTTDIGVGGRGSLNFITALCGPSGAGKGLAETTVADNISIIDHDGKPVETPVLPFGSGEGMASAYRPRGLDPEADHALTRVVFSASEIDKITALSSRTGSTLSSALREAWSGELLGASNATAENSNVVPRHTYRWAAVLGVQPKRAGALLGEANGGTPQRVLWAPVGDPGAPRFRPTDPGPLTITLPRLDGEVSMNVNSEITTGYDEIQHDRLLVGLDGDDIDGHTRMVQLKVAAALALMDGRTVIGVDDWDIATAIMGRSSATRDEVKRILESDRKVDSIRRAEERAEMNLHADDHKEVEARQRVRTRILTVLEDRGTVTGTDLYKAVRYNLREHYDPVLTELIVQEKVQLDPYSSPDAYFLTPG